MAEHPDVDAMSACFAWRRPRPVIANVGRADGHVMSATRKRTRHRRGQTRDATVRPRLLVVRNDVQDPHRLGSTGFYWVLQGSAGFRRFGEIANLVEPRGTP